MTEEELSLLLTQSSESDRLEFKSSFDPNSLREWLEIIKDLVALANSGGGCILFGVNDDGQCSGFDAPVLLALDPADVTNKIYKYTDHQFHDFEIRKADRGASALTRSYPVALG